MSIYYSSQGKIYKIRMAVNVLNHIQQIKKKIFLIKII